MSGRSPRWFTGIQYPYEANFADNTWAQIIKACQKKHIPSTWKVADQKAMTIGDKDYMIDIIGINHDIYTAGGTAPLTFQLHDCYGKNKNMNSSATTSGGWTSCAMRISHLPAILTMMPAEVQTGIREVNKLTSAGNRSSEINTTADKLFLLSEVEIFGSITASASGEGTQYDYYKEDKTRTIKHQNGHVNLWWERSPASKNAKAFCRVSFFGSSSANSASASNGVAFGFCF